MDVFCAYSRKTGKPTKGSGFARTTVDENTQRYHFLIATQTPVRNKAKKHDFVS